MSVFVLVTLPEERHRTYMLLLELDTFSFAHRGYKLALAVTLLCNVGGCGDDSSAATAAGTDTTETSSSGDETSTSGTDTQTGSETGNDDDGASDSEEKMPLPEVDIPELCGLACEAIAACDIEVVDCAVGCEQHHEQLSIDPGALAAEVALTQCVRALDCEALESHLKESVVNFPCANELAESPVPGQCASPSFEQSGPSTCEVELDCTLEPSRRVSCADGSCSCVEDGQEVGSCDAGDLVCAEFSFSAINQCCGWSL